MTGPVEIVAEIANAHQGDAGAAARLARQALSAGADAVKFQIYFAEELLVREHPRYAHFRDQAFDDETWAELLGGIVGSGAKVYCDVFGERALDVARRAGVAGYKIHSSDLGNLALVREAGADAKRVFLSAGGGTAREIVHALDALGRTPSRPVLLHGFQSYPTEVADAVLNRLTWLRDTFGKRADIGYADHVSGDDAFATMLPAMAVAMGALVIEKHVTFDRGAKGVDYYSSLEPPEFAQFVAVVRRAETALRADPAAFPQAERVYRRTVKKHWVTTRKLPEGHILEAGDLAMLRVDGAAAEPAELARLEGRPLLRACPAGTVVSMADVPAIVWALVVARSTSKRLPGKALMDMAGRPALAHLFERLKQASRIERIVLCTTTDPEDDALEALAQTSGVSCHRGPVEDVLGRMLGAVDGHEVDIALRVTGDDILVDPDYVDRAIGHHLAMNAEYSDLKALPSGTEVEVFDVALLRAIRETARDPDGTEYLTTYVVENRDQFRTTSVPVDPAHARDWRLTLDTEEDAEVIRALLEAMEARGKALDYRLGDIVDFLDQAPEVLQRNASVRQRQTPPNVTVDLDWSRIV